MPKKDLNQTAFSVVQRATGAVEPLLESDKGKAGRKGGLKGGVARSAALSPEQRKAIAKKGAATRWKKRRPETVD